MDEVRGINCIHWLSERWHDQHGCACAIGEEDGKPSLGYCRVMCQKRLPKDHAKAAFVSAYPPLTRQAATLAGPVPALGGQEQKKNHKRRGCGNCRGL